MSKKNTLRTYVFSLGMTLIFYFLILTEQVSYTNFEVGKLSSVEEMRFFETSSILVNIFMLMILAKKYRLLYKGVKNKMIDGLIFIFALLFSLNTIGNLFATSIAELILGTIFTLYAAILCFRIAKREG